MKKKTIKIVEKDFFSAFKYTIKDIDAELYEYGGYKFGIYWDVDCFGKRTISAFILETGTLLAVVKESKSPKREILNRIEELVKDGSCERAICRMRDEYKFTQQAIIKKISSLEAQRDELNFPINKI